MKTLIAFIISLAITPLLYACNNAIDGIYVSSSEYMKLVLDNDRFQIIRCERETKQGFWIYEEVLAEGNYTKIDNNLLEFNSDDSYSAKSVASTARIEFEHLEAGCDSVEIVLDIPSDESIVVNLICDLEENVLEPYEVEFDYVRNKHNRINVPRSNNISMSIISNNGTLPNWLPSFYFQGIQEIFIPISSIEKNCSTIQISIPGIKGNYFERMFLKGEYALIQGDIIRFKGVDFVKAHE